MALLDDNREIEAKPEPGKDRRIRPYSSGSSRNPDYEGGKEREGRSSSTSSPYAKDSTSSKTGHYSRPTTDKNFARDAYSQNIMGALGLGNNRPDEVKPNAEENFTAEQEEIAREEANQAIRNAQASARAQTRNRSSKQRPQLPNINLLGKDVKARVAVTRVTYMNATWIGYTWLFLQLPFAILSILSFAIVYAVDEVAKDEGGLLNWLVSKVAAVANEIVKFIGIDFAEIALYVAGGLYMVVLAIGLISIMVVYVQYVASGIRPTTGKASGFKTAMLLLAIIGYSTPMLNIFPFVGLWMLAVWHHPR